MLVPLHHLFRLMPHPRVDQSLVDSLRRTIRCKAVPQHVPSSNSCPFGAGQRSVQMIVCLVNSQRLRLLPFSAASCNAAETEGIFVTGILAEPRGKDFRQDGGQWNGARRVFLTIPLLFPKHQCSCFEIEIPYLGPDQFAPSGTCICGSCKHRMDNVMLCLLTDA